MSQERNLETIKKWEVKLSSQRTVLETLEALAVKMDPDSDDYYDCMQIISEARQDLAAAYAVLTIRKARLGIVGSTWYESQKDKPENQ